MNVKENHSDPPNIAGKSVSDVFYQGFETPGHLYGRNREIETLFAAYDRVRQGQREIMLVSGHSGMGKSALIQEFYSQLKIRQKNLQSSIFDLQSGVRFIFGKFDQFRQNIPYSALTKAFRELTRHILTENATRIERWRKKIMDAVGPSGQIIIDVIPEIERIIGPQPESPPAGSQNRFNMVFQKFVWVFYQPEHPLVIFLDDLQWADAASLRLVEQMFTDEKMQHLFLIGTCDSVPDIFYRGKDVRDRNEMNADHPLPLTLKALQKGGTIINHLTLSPLKLEHVEHAVSDIPAWKSDTRSLIKNGRNLKTVAEMVLHKTAGNPFFVSQLMKTLLKNTELVPENMSFQISAIPGNVTELMLRRLKGLPEPTQQVLSLAAYMGNHFNLNFLSAVYKKSEAETLEHLLPAINEGFVGEPEIRTPDKKPQGSRFRFQHDCIQEVACALLDEDRKKSVCLRIGRLLLAKISDETRMPPKASDEPLTRTFPKVSDKAHTRMSSQKFAPVSDQEWETDKQTERIFELAGIMNMSHEMLTDDREK
ncbi:AAA family ATPase, partial [Desulfobacterales bacterium HSG2]|nr:AAA family ATPase [Desulfobacterales bacterium HSG2]